MNQYYESVGHFIYGFGRAKFEFRVLAAQVSGDEVKAAATPAEFLALIENTRVRLAALGLCAAGQANFDALADKLAQLAEIEARPFPPSEQRGAMAELAAEPDAAIALLALCRQDLARLRARA
jgi:glycosyltransferase involved in cell wall biosynthesis